MDRSTRRTLARRDAPQRERREALTEAQRQAAPRALGDLLPSSQVRPVIDHIHRMWEKQQLMAKASGNVVQLFPGAVENKRKHGMQSVYLDDMQIAIQGDYYERPSSFGFDAMRAMVDGTPILSAIVQTRVRQVERFCRLNEDGKGPGFRLRLKDHKAQMSDSQREQAKALQKFFTNSGWEDRPRHRSRLKRDSFKHLMGKLVRDSLTMDSAPIELEWKRDRSLGLDGMYAVDGSTIRLCTEQGYRGEDEIFALQVIQGNIRAAYTYDDLIYVPRNPRADVMVGGYGMAETELLVRVVTGFLNAFTYNTKFFDSNSIPRGILNLYGSYDEDDIESFKNYWNGMVKGINNAWTLPVMVSKDQESKAQFESFGDPASDVMFQKWMVFLTSIACAIYTIDPSEINFESFSADKSSLSGSDTEEKLSASRDKGLVPMVTHFADVFNEYVLPDLHEDFEFEFTGLEPEDADREWEAKQKIMSVDELRAERGMEKAPGFWGEAPLDGTLATIWSQDRQLQQQAEQQQQQMDFGQPGAEAPGATEEGDFGDEGEFAGGEPAAADPSGNPVDDSTDALAKSLPVYTIKP